MAREEPWGGTSAWYRDDDGEWRWGEEHGAEPALDRHSRERSSTGWDLPWARRDHPLWTRVGDAWRPPYACVEKQWRTHWANFDTWKDSGSAGDTRSLRHALQRQEANERRWFRDWQSHDRDTWHDVGAAQAYDVGQWDEPTRAYAKGKGRGREPAPRPARGFEPVPVRGSEPGPPGGRGKGTLAKRSNPFRPDQSILAGSRSGLQAGQKLHKRVLASVSEGPKLPEKFAKRNDGEKVEWLNGCGFAPGLTGESVHGRIAFGRTLQPALRLKVEREMPILLVPPTALECQGSYCLTLSSWAMETILHGCGVVFGRNLDESTMHEQLPLWKPMDRIADGWEPPQSSTPPQGWLISTKNREPLAVTITVEIKRGTWPAWMEEAFAREELEQLVGVPEVHISYSGQAAAVAALRFALAPALDGNDPELAGKWLDTFIVRRASRNESRAGPEGMSVAEHRRYVLEVKREREVVFSEMAKQRTEWMTQKGELNWKYVRSCLTPDAIRVLQSSAFRATWWAAETSVMTVQYSLSALDTSVRARFAPLAIGDEASPPTATDPHGPAPAVAVTPHGPEPVEVRQHGPEPAADERRRNRRREDRESGVPCRACKAIIGPDAENGLCTWCGRPGYTVVCSGCPSLMPKTEQEVEDDPNSGYDYYCDACYEDHEKETEAAWDQPGGSADQPGRSRDVERSARSHSRTRESAPRSRRSGDGSQWVERGVTRKDMRDTGVPARPKPLKKDFGKLEQGGLHFSDTDPDAVPSTSGSSSAPMETRDDEDDWGAGVEWEDADPAGDGMDVAKSPSEGVAESPPREASPEASRQERLSELEREGVLKLLEELRTLHGLEHAQLTLFARLLRAAKADESIPHMNTLDETLGGQSTRREVRQVARKLVWKIKSRMKDCANFCDALLSHVTCLAEEVSPDWDLLREAFLEALYEPLEKQDGPEPPVQDGPEPPVPPPDNRVFTSYADNVRHESQTYEDRPVADAMRRHPVPKPKAQPAAKRAWGPAQESDRKRPCMAPRGSCTRLLPWDQVPPLCSEHSLLWHDKEWREEHPSWIRDFHDTVVKSEHGSEPARSVAMSPDKQTELPDLVPKPPLGLRADLAPNPAVICQPGSTEWDLRHKHPYTLSGEGVELTPEQMRVNVWSGHNELMFIAAQKLAQTRLSRNYDFTGPMPGTVKAEPDLATRQARDRSEAAAFHGVDWIEPTRPLGMDAPSRAQDVVAKASADEAQRRRRHEDQIRRCGFLVSQHIKTSVGGMLTFPSGKDLFGQFRERWAADKLQALRHLTEFPYWVRGHCFHMGQSLNDGWGGMDHDRVKRWFPEMVECVILLTEPVRSALDCDAASCAICWWCSLYEGKAVPAWANHFTSKKHMQSVELFAPEDAVAKWWSLCIRMARFLAMPEKHPGMVFDHTIAQLAADYPDRFGDKLYPTTAIHVRRQLGFVPMGPRQRYGHVKEGAPWAIHQMERLGPQTHAVGDQ